MPRVLIIPWFFYKSHQLNRYIALYKKLGATKIDILHHNTFNILTPKGLFNFQEQGWKKNIIPYDIVHSFSGGSLIIPYLSHNPNSHYVNVFDSGPMFPSIKQTGQFICNFTGVSLHAQRPFELMVGANWVLQALYYNDDLSTTITRLKKIIKDSHDMIYYISMLSTTGGKLKVSPKKILTNYNKIKRIDPKKNCVIGFGITDKTISQLKIADGLVVGSAICKEISTSLKNRQNPVTNVSNLVKRLKNKIL